MQQKSWQTVLCEQNYPLIPSGSYHFEVEFLDAVVTPVDDDGDVVVDEDNDDDPTQYRAPSTVQQCLN